MAGELGADGVGLVSGKLDGQIRGALGRGEQVILLLNRRGYSNFIYCPQCKHSLKCKHCDVTLTFHKGERKGGPGGFDSGHDSRGTAICHHCFSQTLVPKVCPLCEARMVMTGIGTQRLEEQLAVLFPEARCARIDADSMRGRDYYGVLDDFAAGRVDILAGTQMLAKGLHFPNVTLVGIISADTALMLPDFRSNERTFQLISQVAGRAGRGDKPGRVIVQTLFKNSFAVRSAAEYDFEGFVEKELVHREQCGLPPFGRMGVIHLRDEKWDRLERACEMMKQRVEAAAAVKGISVRGPMPAVISRMAGRHRMQIVVRAETTNLLNGFFRAVRNQPPLKPAVTVTYDIDPFSLL